MIVDLIERISEYSYLPPAIQEGLNYLQKKDLPAMEPGRYSFGEYGSYAGVSVYETKQARSAWPEAHRRHIDIQVVASGIEWIGYAPLGDQKIHKPYDEERDLIFYDTDPSLIFMEPGMFAIFFPGDLHMPGIDRNHPGGGLPSGEVKKIVVKVPLAAVEGNQVG